MIIMYLLLFRFSMVRKLVVKLELLIPLTSIHTSDAVIVLLMISKRGSLEFDTSSSILLTTQGKMLKSTRPFFCSAGVRAASC